MSIGIDIINIDHFRSALTSGGQTFLNNNFHPAETVNKTNEHLAGVFAAKEAIIKTGYVKVLDYLAVQILNAVNGKPVVYDAEGNEIADLELSISHTDTTAVAVAIWTTL
jgi:phosphopantetheine--protein transferase-like protein